jgi:hypothetical protein
LHTAAGPTFAIWVWLKGRIVIAGATNLSRDLRNAAEKALIQNMNALRKNLVGSGFWVEEV